MAQARAEVWWGSFDLDTGRTAHWRIGPLELIVLRREEEWQVGYARTEESAEEPERWHRRFDEQAPEELGNLERFVFRRTEGPLVVQPALADRPVVSSPRNPFHVLPDEETTLYVGSPLWVRIAAGSAPTPICELPIWRPSDTWFGSTREGELCYGSRTRAILDPGNLPRLWRRAITPVLIRNEASEALLVERLKLPVPLLSLYATAEGRLWTEKVSLLRAESTQWAGVELGDGPPEEAAGASQVTPSREQRPQRGSLIRVFSGLFAEPEL